MKTKGTLAILIILLCLASAALGGGLAMLWMQNAPVEIPQISPFPQSQTTEASSDTADPATPGASIPNDTPPADAEPDAVSFFIPEEIPEAAPLPEGASAVGALYVSDARRSYQSGSMQLVIPKLELDEGILDGVSAEDLAAGDGLYPYAQLPSEENGNVSIAGHRNGRQNGRPVASRKFYYLNTLTEGDYLYLIYDNIVYQYLWECTEVILPDNWDPIRNRGYGCITLTTCTPIGVSDHRLVVRGALVDAFPYSSETALAASRPPF